MHLIFYDLLDSCVLVYLDDVLIYSSDLEQHKVDVRKVFARLAEHNLHVKQSKCELLSKRIAFLGHVLSESGIAVDPEKVRAIEDWPVP
jgi:hypothetical protein